MKDVYKRQHKGEYHRWNHKADRIEDIIPLAGKMYLDDTHTGRRVVQEQGLRAVSYTHLDVYKRQLQDFNPNDVHHIVNHSESVFLFTSDAIWEHLEEEDVYKRQI